MPNYRVSQLVAEIVSPQGPAANVRISQVALEALTQQGPAANVRISQVVTEALTPQAPAANVLISQLVVETLSSSTGVPPTVLFWTPSFPDLVPVRHPRDAAGVDPLLPLTPPPPTVLFWTPSFPDQIPPIGSRISSDLIEPLVPIGARSSGAPQGYVLQIKAGASGQYQTTLVGADGVTPLPGELLTALLLTLYTIDVDNLDHIVNNRFKQNVFNTANCQIASSGVLTWTIQPADTTLLDPSVAFERHIGLFEWVVQGGGQGKHEVILVCRRAHLA